jgi:hypothetical protein
MNLGTTVTSINNVHDKIKDLTTFKKHELLLSL